MTTNAGPLPQELIDEFVGASHGDLDRVKELLTEHPALLHGRARWQETPLGAAAHVGQEEVAGFLLARGSPLDVCTAAMLGQRDDVAAFLASDPAQANASGAHGLSVLYHASVRGRREIAEMLVARGADVNAGDGGNTALHGAATFGRLEMVEWLLAHGARANAKDYNGRTPTRVALDAGHAAVADLLRRHGGTE